MQLKSMAVGLDGIFFKFIKLIYSKDSKVMPITKVNVTCFLSD
jgi:hypothetical protein